MDSGMNSASGTTRLLNPGFLYQAYINQHVSSKEDRITSNIQCAYTGEYRIYPNIKTFAESKPWN